MIANSFSEMCKAIAPSLGNHVWQSTLFAIAAGMLTLLLRNNHARTRYWLWLTASIKFLIPFSLLAGLGSHIAWWRNSAGANSRVYFAVDQLSQPFSPSHLSLISQVPPFTHPASFLDLLPTLLAVLWLCGIAIVVLAWYVRWRRISAVMRKATPLREGREVEALRRLERAAGISRQIEMRVSETTLEPGIFGIARPILVWPRGISARLTDSHLDAILAHELCHVRRRDNLTAAVHMAVEGIFWFHPIVWWLGARLLDERERACDEQVLETGSDREVYAESILKICEFCVGSPLDFVSGVTGADLKKRIEAIMTHRTPHDLQLGKKVLLAAIATASVFAPLGFGVLHAAQEPVESQSSRVVTASFYNAPTARVYEAVSVRASKSTPSETPNAEFRPDGFTATNVTLQMLIQQAYGVEAYQISGAPEWLNRYRFDVEAEVAGSLADELRKGGVNQLSVEQRPMLLEALAERFKLAVHRETKELPAYALVPAENGPKLHRATPGDTYPDGLKDGLGNGHGDVMRMLRGQMIGQGVPVEFLVKELSHELGRTVLDRTGLAGNYDFTLQWSDGRVIPRDYIVEPGNPASASNGSRIDERAFASSQSAHFSGPSIFTALHDQLGLELVESNEKTSATQILVIDHVEKPVEPEAQGTAAPTPAVLVAYTKASIKPNKNDTPMPEFNIKGKPFTGALSKPDRFMATNVTLRWLLRVAYGVQDSQIVGGPDWLNSEKFDVDAKVDASLVEQLAKLSQQNDGIERGHMLQALLADRFKITLHREIRELPTFTLVVADGGPKFHAAKPGDTYSNGPMGPRGSPAGIGFWEPERGKLFNQGQPIGALVSDLSGRLGQMVVDKTGLTGNFDFTLQWTPDAGKNADTDASAILAAVQDQLGLKLERQNTPTEVLAIDRAEAISDNASSRFELGPTVEFAAKAIAIARPD
jgi:bla regulator protein BlaR1